MTNKKNTNMNISAAAPISRFNITLGDERQNLCNIGEEWTIGIPPPPQKEAVFLALLD